MVESGYLYIAYKSNRYYKQAVVSAKSLKAVDPDAHITLITDSDRRDDCFDEVLDLIYPKQIKDNVYEAKFWNILRSPYEKTFLVDTDTYFLDNCRGLFELLDHYHFCLMPANSYLPIERKMGFIPYNSGIMLFKNDDFDCQDVLNDTYINFLEKRDDFKTKRFDYYLTWTLSRSNARVYTLPPIFNARFGSMMCLSGPVKILHGAGQGFLTAEQYEDIGKKINKTLGGRYWNKDTWELLNG